MSAQLSLQALRALCDEAALPFDPDNPPGVKGAPPETLNPERHLAACEALAAEAAGEPGGFYAFARLHEEGLSVPQDLDQARRLHLRVFEEVMEAQTRAKAKSALKRLGAAPPD